MSGKDWYGEVTNNLIALLNRGIIPWRKPWRSEEISVQSGQAYKGINALQLNMAAALNDYGSRMWVTFNEAKQRGGSVRKGEKGVPVFKWVVVSKEEEDKSYRCMAYAGTVFNLAQTEGVDVSDIPTPSEFVPILSADSVYDQMPHKPELRHGGNKAYYFPEKDYINLPKPYQFLSPAEYYATLYHELAHATGHSSRLARREVTELQKFGSHDYSVEELVAEFSAAMLCAKVGIANPELTQNSASYIQGWARRLEADKTLIVHASQRAQRAVEYILGE